jgi:two-component system NarL family sensor kinase
MSPVETQELDRLNRELTIISTVAQSLNRSVDLRDALRTTLAQVADLLDLHTGWILLLSEEQGEPYLAAAQNLPPALANTPSRMEGSCYCLDSYLAGQMDNAANINVITCERLAGLMHGTEGLRYHASIPLNAHGKAVGMLNVASRDWRELSSADLRLLYTVGDMLGIAIERARLFAASSQLGALEERNRLAREIHDTLAQGLSAITLQLETADALLAGGGELERVQQAVQQALNLTRANLEEARRSVHDLRAAPLEGRSLPEALKKLLQTFFAETGLISQFRVYGGAHPLPVAVEAGLYRVAQEALNNVAQHAEASMVKLKLQITPERVVLRISDNGRGFEENCIELNRYGIVGMNERVNLLGGTFKLQSSPGAGTKIEVTVPL